MPTLIEQKLKEEQLLLEIQGRVPRKRTRKLPRQVPGPGLILPYYNNIIQPLKRAHELVQVKIFPMLPIFQREMGILDAFPDDLEDSIEEIGIQTDRDFGAGVIASTASAHAGFVSTVNRQHIERQFRAGLGIDIFVRDANAEPLLNAFVSENVNLLKSIPSQYLSEVQNTITRNFRAGKRAEAIEEELVKRFAISERRAALIAMDQTMKLNAQFTRTRQTELGVDNYIWRTALDEKVRPTHADNEGRVFSWRVGPPVTDHPGMETNCRCEAEPDLSAFE